MNDTLFDQVELALQSFDHETRAKFGEWRLSAIDLGRQQERARLSSAAEKAAHRETQLFVELAKVLTHARNKERAAFLPLLDLVEKAIEEDPEHPDRLMRIVSPDDYLAEVLEFCEKAADVVSGIRGEARS